MQRLFNVSILLILQHARVVMELLRQDLPLFAAKDTTFTEDKIVEIQGLLGEAEQLPDEVVVDEQTGLTQQFLDLMKTGKEHYEELSYFVRKAFKDKIVVQNILGKDTFSDAKRNQLAFIQFFRVLNEVQPKYEADLLTVGATPALLARTATLYQDIEKANTIQEVFKKQRVQKTANRIEKVNILYAALRDVEDLALIVHRDNFEMAKAYIVPRASRNTVVMEEIGSVIFPNTQTTAISSEYLDADSILQLSNLGVVPLRFYVTDQLLDVLPDNAVAVAAGDAINILSREISTGKYGLLIVANMSNDEGRYEAAMVD